MSFEAIAPIMFLCALILLFSGYPVAFSLGGTALVFGLVGVANGFFPLVALTAWFDRTFGIVKNYVLLAVPLFIFMGTALEKSRLAEDLLRTVGQLFGPGASTREAVDYIRSWYEETHAEDAA